MTAITEPLTKAEAKKLVGEDGYIEVEVIVDFDSLVEGDLEAFLDLLCERVGVYSLQDVGYQLTGATEHGEAIVRVTGDIQSFLEEE